MLWKTVCVCAVGLAASVQSLKAQDFFDDDFEGYFFPSVVTSSGSYNGYTVLFSASTPTEDFKAIFGFDYSTVTTPIQIPPAPHSLGGTTKGLFLTANKDANGAVAAVNLYPANGFSAGDVSLLFDLWINVTSSGSTTEHALFGINHSGIYTNQIGKAGSDGLFFAMDGDGGVVPTAPAERDYSVFQGQDTNAPLLMLPTNTVFGPAPLLGTNFDNGDPGFTNLFPVRSITGFGNTTAGIAGLQWLSVEVRSQTNLITWLLNGTVVCQYTNTNSYTWGYLMLGYNDAFSSIGNTNLFAIFDNVRLTDPNRVKTWTGAVDTNWFNDANWSPAGAPQSNDTVNVTSGTIGFIIPVTFYGQFNWYGGTLAGAGLTIGSNSVLNINGGNTKVLKMAVTNYGTVSWGGNGTLNVANGTCNGTSGAIVNASNAFFNILGDGVITNNSGCAVTNAYFLNQGTVRKSGGTGSTFIYIPVTNAGTVIPAAGTLALMQDVVLPSSSTLAFPFNGTNIFVKYGQFQVEGALRFGGTLTTSNLYTPNFRDALRLVNCGSHSGGFALEILDMPTNINNFPEAVCDAYGLSLNIYNTNAPNAAPPTNLVNQTVGIGDTATFFITPNGVPPFTYQWLSNNVPVVNETNSSLVLTNVQSSFATTYSVQVISYILATNTYSATLTVRTPLAFTNQPVAQSFTNGSSITLTSGVSGSGPFLFQWRLNGANIIGATASTYTITNAQYNNAGLYKVVVANSVSTVASTNALLKFTNSVTTLADNFSARPTFNSLAGLITGNNSNATREVGEPLHDGKTCSNSMWMQWTAPSNGVVTFSTAGSSFDTILAIYISSNASPSLSNLVSAAANDDKDGKYWTSQSSLSVTANTNYYVAVDGFAGDSGEIILTWSLSAFAPTLPKITAQPSDQCVLPGANALFSVTATNLSNSSYQWYYNDALAIAAATNSSLTISNVGYTNLGCYSVEITGTNGQRVVSRHAALEIGTTGDVSGDKLGDLLFNQPADLLGFARIKPMTVSSVSIGTLGFQEISTYFQTTATGEPISSSGPAPTGSPRWWLIPAGTNAPVIVDTIGSDYDTVLTVYYPNPDIYHLVTVVRDDNGAPDHIRSLATFNAVNGTNYVIKVDGITSTPGKVVVNWRMGVPPSTSTPTTMFLTEASPIPTLNGFNSAAQPIATYQWLLNGAPIQNATSPTYQLPPLAYNSGGIYSVVVSNLMGVVTNNIAFISMLSPLRVTKEISDYRITGSFTQAMALQTSSNLNTWISLITNVNPRVGINYPDPIAPFRTNLFYRLKSP